MITLSPLEAKSLLHTKSATFKQLQAKVRAAIVARENEPVTCHLCGYEGPTTSDFCPECMERVKR